MPESFRYPFGQWLDSRAGGSWIQAERQVMALLAAGLVGGHAVQFGLSTQTLLDQLPAVSRHVLCLGIDGQFSGGVCGQDREWPLQDDSVKLVVSHHAHEAVDQPDRLFTESARILASGGLALFCGLGRRPVGLGARQYGKLRTMPPGELRRQLRDAGLIPGRCRIVSVGRTRLASTLHWLEDRLPVSDYLARLSQGFVMVARKPEDAAHIVNLRSRKSRTLEGAVSGSPVGGV
jgi:SAM-dependent methyltransferase